MRRHRQTGYHGNRHASEPPRQLSADRISVAFAFLLNAICRRRRVAPERATMVEPRVTLKMRGRAGFTVLGLAEFDIATSDTTDPARPPRECGVDRMAHRHESPAMVPTDA